MRLQQVDCRSMPKAKQGSDGVEGSTVELAMPRGEDENRSHLVDGDYSQYAPTGCC